MLFRSAGKQSFIVEPCFISRTSCSISLYLSIYLREREKEREREREREREKRTHTLSNCRSPFPDSRSSLCLCEISPLLMLSAFVSYTVPATSSESHWTTVVFSGVCCRFFVKPYYYFTIPHGRRHRFRVSPPKLNHYLKEL